MARSEATKPSPRVVWGWLRRLRRLAMTEDRLRRLAMTEDRLRRLAMTEDRLRRLAMTRPGRSYKQAAERARGFAQAQVAVASPILASKCRVAASRSCQGCTSGAAVVGISRS
jgi:hypothetical protein